MHSQNLPWLIAEKIRCSMLQATLLANWSRCNRDKAHGTFNFPTCTVVHEKYCWAILHKDKLIKFRSSLMPTTVFCLLLP